MFPKMGPLWIKMPISTALLNIPIRVPNKEALPPGSPHRAPTERETLCFQSPLSSISLEVPGSTMGALMEREMPLSRAILYISFTVPSKAALPLQVPLTELPWTEMFRFQSPPSSISQSPR